MADTTLDLMEYANDAAAQAAFVSSDTTPISTYPPAHSDTYVKATTSQTGSNYLPPLATDPTKSLTGTQVGNAWLSGNNEYTNQRFHIDLGTAKVVKKIYYENSHDSGANSEYGAKNFTFWGSNTAGSFSELTYATDTGWTQLTIAQSIFDVHVSSDVVDPKYITVTNTTAYRYYAFKIADAYASVYIGFRRIVLQLEPLQSYSEDTIIQQGSYSLKGVAAITDSLNDTLTRTI